MFLVTAKDQFFSNEFGAPFFGGYSRILPTQVAKEFCGVIQEELAAKPNGSKASKPLITLRLVGKDHDLEFIVVVPWLREDAVNLFFFEIDEDRVCALGSNTPLPYNPSKEDNG